MNITKRIDLNLGYTCNIRCRFCYYQKSVEARRKDKDLSTDEAKRWLLYFRSKGIEEIDLTGGEPTIRPDIFELASFCRDNGFKKICVITNGLRMSDPCFCEKLFAAGVNDVLFSVHGCNEEIHDALTGTKGSFEKIISAVKNSALLADKYAVRLRSNSVINGLTFKHAEETAELLRSVGLKTINFIMFNPIVEAQDSDAEMNLIYLDAAPFLMRMIDKYGGSFDRITVRYMPFCLMPGYEKYITNTAQIQYDPDEWDYYFRTRFRNGYFLWLGALMFGLIIHPSKTSLFTIGWNRFKHESIKYALAWKNKIKGKECSVCSYSRICDGLWKDYAKLQGFSELRRVSGRCVSDPGEFLRHNIKGQE